MMVFGKPRQHSPDVITPAARRQDLYVIIRFITCHLAYDLRGKNAPASSPAT